MFRIVIVIKTLPPENATEIW